MAQDGSGGLDAWPLPITGRDTTQGILSLRTTLESHAYALSASAGSHPPRDDLWHLWHDNVQGWHGRRGPRWKYDLSIYEDFPLAFHRPMPSARPRSRTRNQSLASTAPAILLPGRVHGQEQAESGMLASGRRSSHYRPLARLVARSSGFRQPGMQPLRAPTAVCHCCWLPWDLGDARGMGAWGGRCNRHKRSTAAYAACWNVHAGQTAIAIMPLELRGSGGRGPDRTHCYLIV